MINIVFVIESLNIGGAEKSLISLLQALDYDRYNVTLITFKSNGYFRDLVPSKVEIIQLDYPVINLIDRAKYAYQRKFNRDFHNAQLFWSIVKNKFTVLNKNYDVAIAYNQGFATYFTDKYIRAAKKLSWLNTDYKKAGYNITFDFPIYRNFDFIVAVSSESKAGLEVQLKSIKKELQIVVINDIIDPEVLAQQAQIEPLHPFDENRINIVSVGRLAAVKGFDMAVQACKILIDKGYPITWYLVGGGQERKKLESMIQNLHLENNFILVGENPNPYSYMFRANIYVQCSLYEGLILTVIEATCLFKPIVTTNFPSAFSILENEKTGLIVSMDPKSIALGVERLINDKELKRNIIQNLSIKENRNKEESLSRLNVLLVE